VRAVVKPLFVSALYHPNCVGGAEKVVHTIAEGLLDEGHQPVVVTTQEGSSGRIAHVNGVKVYYVGLKNLYWPHAREERSALAKAVWHGIDAFNAAMARAVGKVLDAERPDVVHTHSLTGFSCAVWNQAKSRRLPLVHTLHDYSLMCPKTSMFKQGRNCEGQCTACALYTSASKRLSRKVDHVVGVSRFILERHLACGYFQHGPQTHVIYNALAGQPASEPGCGQAGGPLRLGYVGQLIPTKGIGELVSQMGTWQPSQCELVVAGKGSAKYEAMLCESAPKNVRFLGFVDPHEVYRSIDALVVPSLWEEPLGMIVPEAYMHGVPVIVAKRGGLPEMVEEGRTGLVYDPLEPGGLRAAVNAIARDRPRLQEMRRLALAKANQFLLARMRAEYLHLMTQARLHRGTGEACAAPR
jgi:glycosyltransferase involved in cell wall biosynthesis